MDLKVKKVLLSPKDYHAVIFDMDGVITKTATVHAAAWKRLFDAFLERRSHSLQEPFVPFDSEKDYGLYVDGKPRIAGIESFLQSRDITLPMGEENAPPSYETIFGLASLKNGYFLETIKKEGVKPYASTVFLIKELKRQGVKVAVISSSCNSKEVLEAAGVMELFDVRVDGIYSEKHQIKGKPEPDIFIEAAHLLGESPEHAVVVEDAISGVQAGRRGNFALVIGVDRIGQREELLIGGADVVVDDLEEVTVTPLSEKKDAIASFDEIKKLAEGKKVALFLDYDGTLTPIANRPDLALFSEEGRGVLRRLAKRYFVAVISGRDLADVKRMVGVEEIYYSGGHGFEIGGPNALHFENEQATDAIPILLEAGEELKWRLKSVEGAFVECKKFAIALHYRMVEEELVGHVLAIANEVYSHYMGQLRQTRGKMLIELQPKILWNKGKALMWLMKKLHLEEALPIYIGDDTTDEDAFKVLKKYGIGIAVQEREKPTNGSYRLQNPEEVLHFLKMMAQS